MASAVRLLEKARRPVLLAGGGVLWSEASEEIVALSKRLEAPVMSSTGRDDVAPYSYPLYVGTIGRGALPEAQAFFKEADLVLAVGTSLGHTTTFWHPDFFAPGTKLIHIAQDRNNIGRVYPAQVGIQADARIALKALLRSVKLKGVTRPGWLKKAARVRVAQERHRNKAAGYNSRPLDPRRAHAALRKVLPKDAIITLDAGVGPGYVYEYQTFEQPRSLLAPQGLAAIGIGYPIGLGAKLAAPKRPVVTISGDGSFLYNGAELETAVREGHPHHLHHPQQLQLRLRARLPEVLLRRALHRRHHRQPTLRRIRPPLRCRRASGHRANGAGRRLGRGYPAGEEPAGSGGRAVHAGCLSRAATQGDGEGGAAAAGLAACRTEVREKGAWTRGEVKMSYFGCGWCGYGEGRSGTCTRRSGS